MPAMMFIMPVLTGAVIKSGGQPEKNAPVLLQQ